MSPTDAEIIRRSWREPESFAEIFDRHAPHILRYLVRRLGRESAEDVVGETFLAAFDKRLRYDVRRADARPWLYGIATNLVGRHRRREVLRLRERVDTVQVHDHADRVAADVTARSVRPVLVGALAGLSAGDRDVLLLIAWEQLGYEEVSAALGIPVGTVRSRLHRARRQVRQALGATTDTIEELLNHG
ncbi:RNA polymerase sigma factor [Actinokineospora enzanensis]|uniref:RNA polymerase sigma factor n=1 Tax=Actinokineospora enzanensis TaxID=155975 RepID=UPI000377F07C|nr:RNA polymerase sigma factor [Actinokineospora enzanensis]